MTSVDQRVTRLLEEFGSPGASAAWLFCDRHPVDAVAFTIGTDDGFRDLTYGRLRQDSIALAASFRALGVGPGDRVASLLGKGAEIVTTMLAAWRLGAVYVPLFTAFAPKAISYRLEHADVKVVVTNLEQLPKIAASAELVPGASWTTVTVGASDRESGLGFADLIQDGNGRDVPHYVQGGDAPIVHMFTSGTTGNPKGVIHPLRHVAGWVGYLEFALGVTADDRYWCAADPGWAYGLYAGIIAPLASASGNILQSGGFRAESTWAVIRDLGVTNFSAAPTVYRALKNAEDTSESGFQLKRLSSAGEPLTPDINHWTLAKFGLAVHDHYGQTEVGMIFANHHHPDLAREISEGSMGQPLPGWAAVVLGDDDNIVPAGTVGRIAIDCAGSPMMTFRGYQDPTQAASRFAGDSGYYLLGDLGKREVIGDFRFSSRDDDVIIMAGYRIGPFEIESVISQIPQVAECAVVAAPDEIRGEVVEAFIVLRSGEFGSDALAAEIQGAIKNGYSAHAYPRAVHFVESLPKTPSGKVQRFVLREQRKAEFAAKERA
ncbi:AMP-binding protein [Arthrobacter sp. efr-133-TYG-118]|uniref:AMP-binding protein n=1 Tax=Arthrobacter sp. efr-133-TYG-118 TaxID=3040279 RepID=UPI0025508F98|nr:AMP-binding protein [Arthrobacter sp. efr-133-TYG-118]